MASDETRPMASPMETPTPLPPTPLSPEAGPEVPSIVKAVDARAEWNRLSKGETTARIRDAVGR